MPCSGAPFHNGLGTSGKQLRLGAQKCGGMWWGTEWKGCRAAAYKGGRGAEGGQVKAREDPCTWEG